MDIKELNKPQLILLAILLSFITSIATGITTVALMDQAPTSITTPINRVVKQTVEKIVQVPGNTTETTVVVKEEDLVVDAIAKNQSSIFIITKESVDDTGIKIEVSAGRGFALTDKGIIAVDATLTPQDGVYYAKNDSGKFKTTFLSTDKAGFSLIKVGEPVDGKSKLVFSKAAPGDLSKIKVGQKIIVLGSSISSFIFDGNKNMRLSVTKSNAGAMVLDLDGEVLGIALFAEDTSFASIDAINGAMKALDTPKPQ